jgi:hypothetical protein
MLLLERLVEGLEINVRPFAVCRKVRDGCEIVRRK